MKKNSFIEGTIFAYIMILLTKMLGALYVIPFYKIIGESGGVLYSYAYNIYNLFLNISTSGIPTAVAIIIAEYNTLKMFNEREYTYKLANKVIGIVSIIAFLIMFIFASELANFFIRDIKGGNSIENISLVIRVISFCLLIIPFLSITRGYLQGNKYVLASSSSQLIEQIVRIIILLVGSYVAINVLGFSIPIGVSVALSGTVLGGLSALIYLKVKIFKNKKELNKGVTSYKDSKVGRNEIIKKIVMYAIPVIIISITQNLYELIDQRLIIKGLYIIGYSGSKSELLSSIIITWAPKICMVINAIATGLCASIIPFIVSSYVNKNIKELNRKFNQAINTILFIGLPLSAFIIMFSRPIYYLFYGNSEYGYIILRTLSVVSIFFSIQLVINMMLQGMKKYKVVYLNTICGVVINALLDIPLIILFKNIGFYPYLGSLFATMIGQGTAILIVLICLKREFKFNYYPIFKTFINSISSIILMSIFVFILSRLLFNTNSYITTLFHLGVSGILSMSLYFFISYKSGSLYEILGEDFVNKILKKIKIRK